VLFDLTTEVDVGLLRQITNSVNRCCLLCKKCANKMNDYVVWEILSAFVH